MRWLVPSSNISKRNYACPHCFKIIVMAAVNCIWNDTDLMFWDKPYRTQSTELSKIVFFVKINQLFAAIPKHHNTAESNTQ